MIESVLEWVTRILMVSAITVDTEMLVVSVMPGATTILVVLVLVIAALVSNETHVADPGSYACTATVTDGEEVLGCDHGSNGDALSTSCV